MSSGTAKTTTNPLIALLMQHRSPASIAGGVAFGTMLGLIPKDSLLALCLLTFIAVLPINQLVACLAAVLLSLCESLTWGVTDWIGFHTLSLGFVSSIIGTIYQIPIAPWLRLENTVVMGAMVLGSLLWGPCFLAAYRISSRFQKSIAVDEVTALAAAALRRQSYSRTEPVPSLTRDLATATDDFCVLPIDSLATPIDTATPTGASGEHRLSGLDRNASTDDPNLGPEMEEQTLHETLIEVIRFKRPTPQQTITTPVESPSSLENSSMHLTNFIRKDPANATLDKATLPGHAASTTVTTNVTHLHNPTHSKEDSLRHILKHIHTARESKREVERSS